MIYERINRRDICGSCTFEAAAYLRITTWRDTFSREISELAAWTVPYRFYTTVHSARYNSQPNTRLSRVSGTLERSYSSHGVASIQSLHSRRRAVFLDNRMINEPRYLGEEKSSGRYHFHQL